MYGDADVLAMNEITAILECLIYCTNQRHIYVD